MQGKVSIVMPCYNKVEYIAAMFDSIIAQEWDNIELILVNDGSTDGTRDVIAEYEYRFCERGYEVIIVDQENAGVCAAAKAGLERFTGDYLCMIDADDLLDCKYVSTMASWLDKNLDCDFVICDSKRYTGAGQNKKFKPTALSEINDGDDELLEKYLMHGTSGVYYKTMVWVYMARASYIKECDIISSFFTDTKGSHEPGYVIPLLGNSGKFKYFPLQLYHFHVEIEGHSQVLDFAKAFKYREEYAKLSAIAIDRLPNDLFSAEKKRLYKCIASIAQFTQLHKQANTLIGGIKSKHVVVNQILMQVYDYFFNAGSPIIEKRYDVYESGILRKINIYLKEIENIEINNISKRIIAWGALGVRGNRFLPSLKGTKLEPTDLWDAKGDGKEIKLPDLDSLCQNDIVLIFPSNGLDALDQARLKGSGCKFLFSEEIEVFIKMIPLVNELLC